jgi:transposase
MTDVVVIEWIQSKYKNLMGDLDERARRRWSAVEALSLGRGGIVAVAKATGISDRTIRNGIRELRAGNAPPEGRQRRIGGGRKSVKEKDPKLLDALEALVEPATRGDPMSPLKWTCKSTRELSTQLMKCGYLVSHTTVSELLREAGFSLQANRKTIEGKQHPDRDAQFRHISSRIRSQQRAGQPALSVDTKKKEIIGTYKNPGRKWRRKGQPIEVQTHDFPEKDEAGNTIKAVPYGVYDIARNEAWVNVGITHDTAEFAVASIRTWWRQLGRRRYPKTKLRRVLVTADSGGSNGSRNRLWKYELQTLADELAVAIEVCHFPPGTSKWNKIEHRVFCHITRTWRGEPLESYEVVVSLIGTTHTTTGLEVHATLDESDYQKGIKISDADFNTINITPCKFHGDWNYIIKPRTSTTTR